MRGLIGLLFSTALLAPLALAPEANAQIAISIGGPPPVCSYGYYGYAPYSCAPVGYYGSGYFYNGIFLGMGPWAGWGYNHGWGGHRFVSAGGGRYTGGFVGYHGNAGSAAVVRTNSKGSAYRSSNATGARTTAAHNSQPHAAPAHNSQARAAAPRAAAHNSQSHAAAPHAAAHNSQAHAAAPHAAEAQGGGSHGGGGERH
jgi:hypothetical protein